MSNRIAPAVRFVRSLEGDYYLLREAAQILGVSHRTLRNFIASNEKQDLAPGYYAMLGKVKVYLYTDDDIGRIRKYLDSQKNLYRLDDPGPMGNRGRPAKYNDDQRKERQRKFTQVHYYKTKAQKYVDAGQPEKANVAITKMREIQKELIDQERGIDAASG
jgi:hypothetical protein